MTEEKKPVEVPKKFEKLVSEIEKMSVLELSELVKILEEKFGPCAAAGPAPPKRSRIQTAEARTKGIGVKK